MPPPAHQPLTINHQSSSGFTLVELLIVITIITILAVIGALTFTGMVKSSRDAKRRADLRSISLALEQYKQKNGNYPLTGGAGGWVYSDAGGSWIPGLDDNYIPVLPRDPFDSTPNTQLPPFNGGYTYGYLTGVDIYGGNGEHYVLAAHLEAPNASDLNTQCHTPKGPVLKGINNLHFCSQQ